MRGCGFYDPLRMRPGLLRLLAAAALALAVAGCGSSAPSRSAPGRAPEATLLLDFTPNAVHAGIYAALARGYDRAAGVRLRVDVPSSSTDSARLLQAGRVEFAILDIHDLAIARERGARLVGVMAIVERPLASVIAQPSVTSPRSLAGRRVGVTGAASDYAVLRSVVAGAGGDPQRVHTIDIGFDAVPDLLAGRVAAATAFWNDEGVALARRRVGERQFHVFRVDAFGAPSYPELVLCTRASTVSQSPGLIRSVVSALERGYRFTMRNPGASAADLERQVPGLDPGLVTADLRALRPAFGPRPGVLDAAVLRAWSGWEARFRIVPRPPDVSAMFDPQMSR